MTNNSTSPDAVIVGGGVIGCGVAYFLASEHHLRCVIIERNAIASEASGGAAGELAAATWHRYSETLTQFILKGVELHTSMAPALLEESGVDYLLADIPTIRPAFNEQEASVIKQQIPWLHEHDINVEWLEPEGLQGLRSWLTQEAIGAAYSVERQLEAYPFALALAQAAERHSVEIRTGEVTGLISSGGHVTGVQIGDETVSGQVVVIANGPWSQHTGAWMGLDIPVIPLRGQIVHVEPPTGVPMPRHAIFHETGYVLPKMGGDLLIGTTQEDAGFDKQPTMEAQNGILEAVIRLAPNVIDAPIKDLTACLRPYTRDEIPIVGAVPGWEGLYLATGHAFKGITLALINGQSLAQLIVTGSSDFPLDEFSPARLVSAG